MFLADKIQRQEAFFDDTPLTNVFDFFRRNEEMILIPIIDHQKVPLGILRERDMKSFVYAKYGKEILQKKRICDFIHRTSICDRNTKVETLLELFTEDHNADGLIITENNEYYGFLSTTSLLKMVYEKTLKDKNRESIESLIIGVAHEVNTPVGVCVTSTSCLYEQLTELKTSLNGGQMRRSDLTKFISKADTINRLLETNLNRAVSLLQGFKRVSVHNTSETRKQLNLKEFTTTALLLFSNEFKQNCIDVKVKCSEELQCLAYQQSFIEIISILVENSLLHGFEKDQKNKEITLKCKEQGEYLFFSYCDNGGGMAKDILKKIFTPFFTTKRGTGSSGLGLNILLNLVTCKMQGEVSCESDPGKGTKFTFLIPMQ